MEKFRISVRSLVEFLLRSGDIDGGKGGMADKEAMQLGSRIHRKIQGSMGAGYRPEVSLKAEIVKETFTLFVEGRADGILEQDGRITVVLLNRTEEEIPVYLRLGEYCAELTSKAKSIMTAEIEK